MAGKFSFPSWMINSLAADLLFENIERLTEYFSNLGVLDDNVEIGFNPDWRVSPPRLPVLVSSPNVRFVEGDRVVREDGGVEISTIIRPGETVVMDGVAYVMGDSHPAMMDWRNSGGCLVGEETEEQGEGDDGALEVSGDLEGAFNDLEERSFINVREGERAEIADISPCFDVLPCFTPHFLDDFENVGVTLESVQDILERVTRDVFQEAMGDALFSRGAPGDVPRRVPLLFDDSGSVTPPEGSGPATPVVSISDEQEENQLLEDVDDLIAEMTGKKK